MYNDRQVIFTDGACDVQNSKIVVEQPGQSFVRYSGILTTLLLMILKFSKHCMFKVHSLSTGANSSLLLGFRIPFRAKFPVPLQISILYTDSSFVVKIVEAITQQVFDHKTHQMAHCDLVQRIRATWDPFHFRVFKVKSHRSLDTAHDRQDLYTILGNALADKTAKTTNKQHLPIMTTITTEIADHCETQKSLLLRIYRYLVDLNSLHSIIWLEKEKAQDGDPNTQGIDDIFLYQDQLLNWVVAGPEWTVSSILLPVVAHACPAGYGLAKAVWAFFESLTWRHPDLPLQKNDYGVTCYELAIHFTLFAGACLPVAS